MESLLPIFPRLHVGAEALGQLRHRFIEAGREERIPRRGGVLAESTVGGVQPVDDALGRDQVVALARTAGGTTRSRVLANRRRCHIA